MTTPNTIVEVDNVTIRTAKGVLLGNISFSIRQGEIVILLGASGCGKTTLIKHIMGLYAPDSGTIRLCGGDPTETAAEAMCGFGVLYQSSALFGSMSLLENVALPLEEHTDLPAEAVEQLARQKLALVGLAGFEHYLPAAASGGMKKRAGLARAMALDPPLLFLDEPSSGLDPITSAGLDQLILSLRDHFGTTMIIVTHELDSIFAIGDRAIVLKDRAVAADGPVRQVARDHADPWVRDFFTRSGTKKLQVTD